MHPVDQAFQRSEGFLRRRDLIALGLTDYEIRRHLRSGVLRRTRHGWYHDVRMVGHPDAELAVRVGGRLTGMSALASYGIWVPAGQPLTIEVPKHARALRSPTDSRRILQHGDGCVVRWRASPLDVLASTWRVPVLDALHAACVSATREDAVIALDSSMQLGHLRDDDLARLAQALPRDRAPWLDLIDGRAESGGETCARLRLRDAGLTFEPQVEVPGVGRLDGRVGRRTYVEIDGFSAHSSREAFERDRARDLAAALWGLRVVRLSSAQVFTDWPLCLAAIRAALTED